jgi:hypothetical protein
MRKQIISQLTLFSIFILCLALTPWQAQAQGNGYPEQSEAFTREELAQMLAPIALYPDALLAQVLMASTYPIEVIEADRWVRRNPGLKGDDLDRALLDREWDPSVKAIAHFPSVAAMMSERITETIDIGNAFLAQEGEVMAMTQELRAKAYAQGNLATSSQQKVIVEKQTIIIAPANPRVVYVPYYDPFHIYGPWWYPAYPPYYWGPAGVSIGIGMSYWPGYHFGFAFGTWSYFDWRRNYIYIDVQNRPRFVRQDRWIVQPGRWHHVPEHRRGVAYYKAPTARKSGTLQYSTGSRRDGREFPVRVDQGQRGRGDEPTRVQQGRSVDDRSGMVRDRREQQRNDREQPPRIRAERDRPVRANFHNQEQESVERDRQERARVARQKADEEDVRREKRQDSRGKIFNQFEDSRGERDSRGNERSRISQKESESGSRDRNRSGSDDRGGENSRGRNGR